MEIIENSNKMFFAYFKIFKKQPTQNSTSNMEILKLTKDTLQYPLDLEIEEKTKIENKWNSLQILMYNCSYNGDSNFDKIEETFNDLIDLYICNKTILNWYENYYKENLIQTKYHIENNKYIWTIKNLEHHTTGYMSFYESRYS